jgi:hypothetical protein
MTGDTAERPGEDAKLSTAEQIRRLVPKRQADSMPLAPSRTGISAEEAMACVQRMAASPGHPTSHQEDVLRMSPIISMFTSALTPQHGAQPAAQLTSSATEQQPTPGARELPGFTNIFDGLPSDSTVQSHLSAPDQRTPASQSRKPSWHFGAPATDELERHAAPKQPAAAAGSASSDDAVLDVLTATMDAWEQALTQRLTTAITTAVKAARGDVMQVCIHFINAFCLRVSNDWIFRI